MNICLFGAARDNVPTVYQKETEALGRLLARRGHTMVFGGGITGIMGAAAKGVLAEGGRLIGVAPRFFDRPSVLVSSRENLIFTDTMSERKELMENLSDGFIAAPGGIGTMDEFFQVFTLRTLGLHQKPVALFNIAGYYDGLLAFLDTMQAQSFTAPAAMDYLEVFSDPAPMLDFLER